MSGFEIVVVVILIITTGFTLCSFNEIIELREKLKFYESNRAKVESRFDDFEAELRYQKLLPKIEEITKLQGYVAHSRANYKVRFKIESELPIFTYLCLDEIKSHLETMKSAIANNCPKKCTRKRK